MSNVTYIEPREGPAPIANLDAEQGVLGAALYDNSLLAELDELDATHFSEGVHARIWLEIVEACAQPGGLADPTLLQQRMKDDPDLKELGGARFLADLVDKAPGARVAEQYARLIRDLSGARGLIRVIDEAAAAVRRGEPSAPTIANLEGALLALRVGVRSAELVSAAQGAADVLADLDAPEHADGGVSTGLEPLDEHLGQLLPDDLILMAARPGAGKSALAASVALNVSAGGIGVVEINSEMTVRQMMRRHLTDLCFTRWGWKAPTYKDIRRRRISGEQRKMLEWAAEEIGALPLAMVKRTGLTLASLRSLVRRQAAQWEARGVRLGLVTVDHVGLLKSPGARDRYTEQTELAIGMKALADELHVPVIALVQLNRKVEDRDSRKPQLSDLRDTGAWEENADTVIGLYRDAYYALKETEPKLDTVQGQVRWAEWDRRRRCKTIEAILLKVREGEEGVVNLWASIGHNAIRGAEPATEGGLF